MTGVAIVIGFAGEDGKLVDVSGRRIGVDANAGLRRRSLILGEFVADLVSNRGAGEDGLISMVSATVSNGLMSTSVGFTSSMALMEPFLVSSSSSSSSNNSSIPLKMSISKSSSLVLSTSLRVFVSAGSRPTLSV